MQRVEDVAVRRATVTRRRHRQVRPSSRRLDELRPPPREIPFRLRSRLHLHHEDVARQLQREPQPLLRHPVPLAHRDDHDRRLNVRHVQRERVRDLDRHRPVVPPHHDEDREQARDQQRHDPGAFGELGDQHDDESVTPVATRAEAVDHHRRRPARSAGRPPVADHAGLREREGEKRADREQRNQPIGDAAENDEQERRQAGQDVDPERVHEPAAAGREDPRQEAVLGDQPAEPREVGEAGVGRQREDHQDRADGDVVERSGADDGRDQLRQDALIAGDARLGGADVVNPSKVGDAGQQHDQDPDDRRQRPLRVLAPPAREMP